MRYDEWLASVTGEITGDAFGQMRVYRLAVFAGDLAWQHASKLTLDRHAPDQTARRAFHAIATQNTEYAINHTHVETLYLDSLCNSHSRRRAALLSARRAIVLE